MTNFFKEGQHDYCAKFMLTAVSHNDNPAFVIIFRDKKNAQKNLNNDWNQKVNVAKHTRFTIFVISILQ